MFAQFHKRSLAAHRQHADVCTEIPWVIVGFVIHFHGAFRRGAKDVLHFSACLIPQTQHNSRQETFRCMY